MMKEQTNAGKRRIRNDILLIVALLAVAAIGAVYLFCFRPQGGSVTVTVDGEAYATYPLSQDRVVDIVTGDSGEQHNRLVIADGKACVETATCPDGICAAHAPVFRQGESIVCLPHRVVITVVANHRTDDPDIIL